MKSRVLGCFFLCHLMFFSVNSYASLELAPKSACTILLPNFSTGGWKTDGDDEWRCNSRYHEIGDGYPLSNNLAYYVRGTSDTVESLKLVLNINDIKNEGKAKLELVKTAKTLFKKALNSDLPSDVKQAILLGKSKQIRIKGRKVIIAKIDWPTGRGYEVQFIIY